MTIDPWLPIGFEFPEGEKAKSAILEGENWQIYEVTTGGKTLAAKAVLGEHWINSGLLADGILKRFSVGKENYFALSSSGSHILTPIRKCPTPENKNEVNAFVEALRLTREIDKKSSLHNAIYVEKYSRLLPTYEIADLINDDLVLGSWLSGGVQVSAHSTRRLRSLTSWLAEEQLQDALKRAGLSVQATSHEKKEKPAQGDKKKFELPGRAYLENFFNEHVIDIVENQQRYKALGIDFPSAIILHGPPGCGKTFAVEKLVEYLDWPCYQIEASSVASPYIHETSKRIAALFDKAIENAPAVIVIDEMDAFLSDRQSAGHQHSVEEISEFLRRIPEAIKNKVLIVGMTNRLDMVDPAILRRGRFDHIIKVDMASEQEILALLKKLVSDLPTETDVTIDPIAAALAGRPLSDVAFVVREGARLAARAGKDRLNQDALLKALETAPARGEKESSNRIGFIV